MHPEMSTSKDREMQGSGVSVVLVRLQDLLFSRSPLAHIFFYDITAAVVVDSPAVPTPEVALMG